MPELTSLMARFATTNNPLLCLDACAVLDVINAGYLQGYPVHIIPAAIKFLKLVESGDLSLIVTETVIHEVQRNIDNLPGRVDAAMKEFDQRMTIFRDAVMHAVPTATIPTVRLKPFQHGNILKGIAEQLIQKTIVISEDAQCIARARVRNNSGLAPSHKKQQLVDCEMVEHYLEFSRLLKAQGCPALRIFVSSNSEDFGTPNLPATPLDLDFPGAAIQFHRNLAEANSGLNL